MHAFSLPDVSATADDDAQTLRAFASVLNVYQLGEDPLLLSGQTFSPDRETPRRVVERWPDTEYPPEHALVRGGRRLSPFCPSSPSDPADSSLSLAPQAPCFQRPRRPHPLGWQALLVSNPT
jgi:hypothetical protein